MSNEGATGPGGRSEGVSEGPSRAGFEAIQSTQVPGGGSIENASNEEIALVETLNTSCEAVLAEATDRNKPASERILLVNDPRVISIMRAFQTFKFQPTKEYFARMTGGMVDKLFAAFQEVKVQYDFQVTEEVKSLVHQHEGREHAMEREEVQKSMDALIRSPYPDFAFA